MQPIVKFLRIKNGDTKNEEGESVGDHWPIAFLGQDSEGYDWTVTTSYIRASELGEYELLDPETLAPFIVDAINQHYADKLKGDLFK